MPMSGGSLMNLAPPTSSSYSPIEVVDSPEDTNHAPPSRPRLGLQMPGGPSPSQTPAAAASDSNGSSGFSIRPNLSLVYGSSGPAPPSKPKLGLSLGGGAGSGPPSKPKLGLKLGIPEGGGRTGPDSALDSYYGMMPSNVPPPPPPAVNLPAVQNLSTPMTEPFSAETLRPPIATIVPSAKGPQSTNSVSDLQKAIEALKVKDSVNETSQETIQWDNSMFDNIRRLGEGAGGAVYQVEQKSTGKMMAMKVCRVPDVRASRVLISLARRSLRIPRHLLCSYDVNLSFCPHVSIRTLPSSTEHTCLLHRPVSWNPASG